MSSSPQKAGAGQSRQKRKQILVLPGMQFGTLVPLVVFVALFAVLVFVFVLMPLNDIVERESDPALRQIAAEQTNFLHARIWMTMVLCFLVGGVVAVYRSHAIAGPLSRLERTLLVIARGHTVDFKVRRGEPLGQFEAAVRALVEGMQTVIRRNREVLLGIQSQVRNLHLKLGQGDVPQKEIRDVTYGILSQFERIPDLAQAPRKS